MFRVLLFQNIFVRVLLQFFEFLILNFSFNKKPHRSRVFLLNYLLKYKCATPSSVMINHSSSGQAQQMLK